MKNSENSLQQQFNEQFGDYLFDELNHIAVECVVNYIPLRNHFLSVQMLENDEMYDTFSQSEKFNWKNNFLTPEEEREHICLMSNQFQQKCQDISIC